MLTYLIRRLLQTIPILFGVAVLTFLLFSVFGEDPVRLALGQHATTESYAALAQKWGLDKPLWSQFLDFLWQIVTFDYGNSYSTGEELSVLFADGVWVSLSLTVPPFILGLIFNVSLALLISHYRGSFFDRFSTTIFTSMMSVSFLVYIIAMQYFLTYKVEIFPTQGYEHGVEAIQYLMLPWLIYMIVSLGPDVRIYRTVFLDESNQDYIRTARAKGANENRVLFIHLFKNAMIPVITYTITAIPFLILGGLLMERYFSLPGVGDLLITAINEGDFPIIKGMTIMIAILFTLFNLLTDILYAVVDPRVKLS